MKVHGAHDRFQRPAHGLGNFLVVLVLQGVQVLVHQHHGVVHRLQFGSLIAVAVLTINPLQVLQLRQQALTQVARADADGSICRTRSMASRKASRLNGTRAGGCAAATSVGRAEPGFNRLQAALRPQESSPQRQRCWNPSISASMPSSAEPSPQPRAAGALL